MNEVLQAALWVLIAVPTTECVQKMSPREVNLVVEGTTQTVKGQIGGPAPERLVQIFYEKPRTVEPNPCYDVYLGPIAFTATLAVPAKPAQTPAKEQPKAEKPAKAEPKASPKR